MLMIWEWETMGTHILSFDLKKRRADNISFIVLVKIIKNKCSLEASHLMVYHLRIIRIIYLDSDYSDFHIRILFGRIWISG